MKQLSINQWTTYRWSLEEDVQHYTAAGIGAIGVWRHKLSDFGEERGAELLREHGLQVSSLSWAGGFTGSDGRSHHEGIEDALDAVRLAAELQASALIVHTGARAGHTHNHARRLVKSALTEVAPLAEASGVMLALEPMHPGCATEWTFLHSLEDALQLIGEIGSPAVKIALDTYHLCQNGLELLDTPRLVEHLALVQLGDSRTPPQGEQNRCPLGEGSLPLEEVVSRLLLAGYKGYWEVELLGEDVEHVDYNELLTQSQRVAQQWLSQQMSRHHAPS